MAQRRDGIFVYLLVLLAAFSFRVAIARLLPNDDSFDGKVYAQIAKNLIEQHTYSHATEPPFDPSLIRVPGYPLFIAGVYLMFGHGDDTAVRIVQALLDTVTCALIALVAFFWEPDQTLKRSSSLAALGLAAICPFTAIYVATILAETGTTFLAVAMCLVATFAFKETRQRNALLLWVATGLLAGLAVLFRPDAALFALAIGITLVITTLLRRADVKINTKFDEFLYRFSRASYLGATFSLAFCLVLVPWTIRNFRVFRIFQPLAPVHATMPGEFVPRGYLSWVRSWIDDGRYIGPLLWSLDESPIKLEDIPERAFDSAEEKQRVAALLDKYNHPPEQLDADVDSEQDSVPLAEQDNPSTPETGKTAEEPSPDEPEEQLETDETKEATAPNSPTDQSADQPVEMTPDIDAGFAQIAKERIVRHPARHYLLLPARRAFSIWFDTHSQFYPFEGELRPLTSLSGRQQFWLPLFAGLTLIYTLLGFAGGWYVWQRREFESRQWVLLAALLICLRVGFFAALENPEPRYVVEVFPFLSVLGGLAVTRMLVQIRSGPISLRKRGQQ